MREFVRDDEPPPMAFERPADLRRQVARATRDVIVYDELEATVVRSGNEEALKSARGCTELLALQRDIARLAESWQRDHRRVTTAQSVA